MSVSCYTVVIPGPLIHHLDINSLVLTAASLVRGNWIWSCTHWNHDLEFGFHVVDHTATRPILQLRRVAIAEPPIFIFIANVLWSLR